MFGLIGNILEVKKPSLALSMGLQTAKISCITPTKRKLKMEPKNGVRRLPLLWNGCQQQKVKTLLDDCLR